VGTPSGALRHTRAMSRRATWWCAVASFWAVVGLFSGFQVWISMITHGHSVPLLLGYHVAVWEGWLLPTWLVGWLVTRWPVVPARRLHVLIHVLAACVIAVVHGLYWLGLLFAMRPFDKMQSEASSYDVPQILFFRLPLEWLLYGLVLGGTLTFELYGRYRAKELREAQLEASLAEARLRSLEQQIQPHFLFNTMNAITALVRNGRNDEAVTMMASLGDLLRYALDHAGDQPVTVDEELNVLERYLEIQRARFPDRMSFRIDAGPDARRASVPAFLLQPLAENAVRHGIAESAAPGLVEVRASRDGDRLRVEVFNTGRLDTSSRGGGIGLRNTRERLHHLYGDAGRLELADVDGGGVRASLEIPWSVAR